MQAALKTGDEVQAQSLEEAGSGTRPRLLKGRLEILRRPAQDPYPAFTAFFVNGQEANIATVKKVTPKAELTLTQAFSNDCHDQQGKFCESAGSKTPEGSAGGKYWLSPDGKFHPVQVTHAEISGHDIAGFAKNSSGLRVSGLSPTDVNIEMWGKASQKQIDAIATHLTRWHTYVEAHSGQKDTYEGLDDAKPHEVAAMLGRMNDFFGGKPAAAAPSRLKEFLKAEAKEFAATPGPKAAGLAVVAQDTGRVLMLQRALSDNDPAGGKWEFPGGTLDPNETPKDAATREWSEETGATLPAGTHTDSWTSPNGVYQGFVYQIPQESDLPINLDHEDRNVLNPDDPDGDQIETVAWWAPEDLRNNPALRDEAHSTDWDALRTTPAALTSLDLTLFNRLFEFYNANHDERGRFTANGGSKAERNIPVTPFRDEDKEFERVAQLEKHYGRKEMAPEMGGPQWAFEGGSPPITEAAKDVLQGYPYDHHDNYRAYDHASYQAADTILHTIEHESSDVPLYSGHKRGRDAVQAMIEEGVEFPLVATSPDRKLADAYAGKGSTLADSPVAVVFEFPKGSQAGFYQANESIATGTYKVASHEWSNDETQVTLHLQQTKRVTVPEKTHPEED